MTAGIAFEGVHKAFSGRPVLAGVSFEIPAGQVVFVIGRSGTGKSVLLKHVVGLLQPDAGRVRVDGALVSAMSERELFSVRRACAMVFQFPALLDFLTIRENLLFGLRASPGRLEDEGAVAREALRLVGLDTDCLDRFPTELSHSTQKRIAVARALVLRPRHLLFDEPTTGLDPVAVSAVNALIRDLSRRLGATAIVVSHDMHCALAIADRVLLLDEGRIVVDAPPGEMAASGHPTATAFWREGVERRVGA